MEDLAQKLASKANKTIATALIDLDTFEPQGIWHSVGYFSDAYINMVALSAAELFRGPRIIKVEELISAQRDMPFQYHIDEYYFHTKGTHHYLMIVPETAILAVLITPTFNDRETDRNILLDFLPIIKPRCPKPLPIEGFNV
ncbi:MAG: hypothetical protein R8M46_00040 [Ghiorsea sp.]